MALLSERELAEQIKELMKHHADLEVSRHAPPISVPFVDTPEAIDRKQQGIEWKICKLANELATLVLAKGDSNAKS